MGCTWCVPCTWRLSYIGILINYNAFIDYILRYARARAQNETDNVEINNVFAKCLANLCGGLVANDNLNMKIIE